MVELAVGELRVIERRPDGSGIVEIPVATAAVIDLSRTKSSLRGMFDLGLGVFQEVVANFARRPGPKPVYFGHIPTQARQDTPAAGFVEAAFIEGGQLWNRVDLNAESFQKVVTQRGFRAASIEIDPDMTTPTGVVPGWSQGGLAITNSPATDVEFRVAASRDDDGDGATVATASYVPTPPDGGGKERPMEVTLSSLQAECNLLRTAAEADKARTTALAADLEQARGGLTRAVTERDEARVELAQLKLTSSEQIARQRALEAQVSTLTLERDASAKAAAKLEKAQTNAQVARIIRKAMTEGVDAAVFAGAEGNEGDWLSARFASLEAFEEFVGAMPKRKGATFTSQGKSVADDDDGLPASIAASLRERGINPAYATIRDSRDLAARRASIKGKE